MPSVAVIGGVIACCLIGLVIVLSVYFTNSACPSFGANCHTGATPSAASPSTSAQVAPAPLQPTAPVRTPTPLQPTVPVRTPTPPPPPVRTPVRPPVRPPAAPDQIEMDLPNEISRGRFINVERADNRLDYINLLGIDVFDKNGARITTGITPIVSPVYLNDPSQYGPQFLSDGVHRAMTEDGKFRLPMTTFARSNYMQLDLGRDTDISKIVIYNRTDSGMERINGCVLQILDSNSIPLVTIPLSGSKAIYTFTAPFTNSSTSSTYVPEPYSK